MKEIKVSVNSWYVVEGTAGATVTNPSTNRVIATVEDGKQASFYATTPYVLASDDSVSVYKATFNSAPAKLRLLGLLGGGVQVDPALMKYANCVTVEDMAAVNADYKNDLTADDLWVYPLPKLKNGYLAFNTFEKGKGWQVDLPALENGGFMLVRYGGEVFDRQLPKLTNGASMFRNMAGNKVFRSALPDLTDGSHMFRGYNSYGVVYLSFESALPKLSKGDGMFDLCALDKQSVLNICNSLPTWPSGTHNITLGIHADYETDADIATAVSEAEAKGWAVATQIHGTATAQAASTWGLRRKPIYAKVGTMELPDGTTGQYLAWGHYVTNAEENGYQEFASIEEANAYFGIQEELLTDYNENEQ